MNTSDNNQPLDRLWINEEWYIPVDETGRCIGTCYEGALGFIIKLESASPKKLESEATNESDSEATNESDSDSGAFALKIPRLMGETPRENAYINDLMEKELWAVREIFRNDGKVNPEALLNAQVFQGSLLRGPINTKLSNNDSLEWDDSLVFVNYEKGQNPQFYLVKEDDKDDKKIPGVNYPLMRRENFVRGELTRTAKD